MESLFPCPGTSFRKKFSFAPLNLTQHQCFTHVQGGGNGAIRADFTHHHPPIFFVFHMHCKHKVVQCSTIGAWEAAHRSQPEGCAAPGCGASLESGLQAIFPPPR